MGAAGFLPVTRISAGILCGLAPLAAKLTLRG
jgi:hypothetical protein